jgi:hypothetical protein
MRLIPNAAAKTASVAANAAPMLANGEPAATASRKTVKNIILNI